MPSSPEAKLTAETLVRLQLAGKNEATGRYDAILAHPRRVRGGSVRCDWSISGKGRGGRRGEEPSLRPGPKSGHRANGRRSRASAVTPRLGRVGDHTGIQRPASSNHTDLLLLCGDSNVSCHVSSLAVIRPGHSASRHAARPQPGATGREHHRVGPALTGTGGKTAGATQGDLPGVNQVAILYNAGSPAGESQLLDVLAGLARARPRVTPA